MSGFLNNSSCGFAKVAVHLCNVNKTFFTNNINIDEILNQNMTTEEKYARYIIFFEERDDYRVDNMQNFRNGMLRLKCIFDKFSKHNGTAKKCFFQTFSPENFMKLDTDGRRKHTLYNCMGCLNNAKYNEAINKLQNVKPAKKNTPIIADKMRMFHGDGPASQFEIRNSKGGDYFCCCCDVPSFYMHDFVRCGYAEYVTLKGRMERVNQGTWGRRKSIDTLHPFADLNKVELKQELNSRNVYNFNDNNKENMNKLLRHHLNGVQRVPSFFYSTPSINNFHELHLENYEVSGVEPLHDIAGHIKNIIEEIPYHLDVEARKKFNEFLQTSLGQKDTKRSCDYRLALIELTYHLRYVINDDILELLLTLIEIQRILYFPAEKRTTREVLKLTNITFLHFHVFKLVFSNAKKLTTRKLFGKYFHQLTIRVPIQYRIISGNSVVCENQEHIFHLCKDITKKTSSNHPCHVIGNLILRYQIE